MALLHRRQLICLDVKFDEKQKRTSTTQQPKSFKHTLAAADPSAAAAAFSIQAGF
jgi:hypothetical protein